MTGYERLLKVMREQPGRDSKGYPVRIGTMKEDGTCAAGDLEIDAEDLYVSTRIKDSLKDGDMVFVARVSDTEYAILEKAVRM